MMLSLAGIVVIMGFIVWIITTFRSDGARIEKIKEAEAINDQNDELLDFIRKQKNFEHRLRNDPVFADKVRNIINDNGK